MKNWQRIGRNWKNGGVIKLISYAVVLKKEISIIKR